MSGNPFDADDALTVETVETISIRDEAVPRPDPAYFTPERAKEAVNTALDMLYEDLADELAANGVHAAAFYTQLREHLTDTLIEAHNETGDHGGDSELVEEAIMGVVAEKADRHAFGRIERLESFNNRIENVLVSVFESFEQIDENPHYDGWAHATSF